MELPYPFNKALLPLGDKAVLTHILEKFPKHSRFVIAVGYCAQQVRDFIKAAHPDLDVTFVTIKNADGPQSGPGRSALECENELTEPFYLVTCDTLWDNETPLEAEQSWVGVSYVSPEESPNYCHITSELGRVLAFIEKQSEPLENSEPFIGLAFIQRPDLFFEGLRESENQGELQLSEGLSKLIPAGLNKKFFSWLDLGTYTKYRNAAARYDGFNFSKTGESLFFADHRVIKFFKDPQIVENRVRRALLKTGAFPKIQFSGEQFFAYDLIEGKTLYEMFSLTKFRELLFWCERNLWSSAPQADKDFARISKTFYFEKSKQRLTQWQEKYPLLREPPLVNGERRPSLYALFDQIPWESLFKESLPYFIHGDLQPDNIICCGEDFKLIDWRQDFGGALDFGDLYYDFAKLRGGLLLNYQVIKRGKWTFMDRGDACEFNVPPVPEQAGALDELRLFTEQKKLSSERVRLITGLVYLNMAPLHEAPFDKLLWNYAREILDQELNPRKVRREESLAPTL